jgi:Ulp1 family protease
MKKSIDQLLIMDANSQDEVKREKVKNAIKNIEAFVRIRKSSIQSPPINIKPNVTTMDLTSDYEDVKPREKSDRYTVEDVSFSTLYENRFDILKDIEIFHKVNELKNIDYKDDNEVAFSRSGNSFTFKTLETLGPKQCINSQIIEVMTEILFDRHVAKTKNEPTIVYLHNYFFKEIMKGGVYTFKPSKFKHLTSLDKLDSLFIPVHHEYHFFLMVYNFKAKTIKYYDSMFNEARGNDFSQILLKYIIDLYGFYKMEISKDEIFIDISNYGIPQQRNSFDCGVFTILFMDLLIDNIDFKKFSNNHIGSFREMILLNLYRNKLTY